MKQEDEKPLTENSEILHRCKGCGYPIHPSEDWCAECLCEDDGLLRYGPVAE